ncbi:MAG: hypothetical protein IPN90_01070 [Elusimicrobia bacterium]|nr:hypothetical protein [Elusimicrobiota bacterium]
MSQLNRVFNDKASLVLRAMLENPEREWVVRDFVNELSLGRGWVASVMAALRQKGFLKGKARGRAAGSFLRNPRELVQEWTHHYRMEHNPVQVYYTSDTHILPRLKAVLQKVGQEQSYALTLHSGANLITHHVQDPNLYVYLSAAHYSSLVSNLRLALGLKELKQGGNVYFFRPSYRFSIFPGIQKIAGYPVVSNLQLYLDLFHFPARGREHAEYLDRILKEKGQSFA